MEREIYTASLTRKVLLSDRTQCFHLEFTVEELEQFDFRPGQFITVLGDDEAGKQQTRAYSIACAPRANQFDLCANRVAGGFFSNLLCDLEVGQSIRFHGPHGFFVLRNPPTDSIFVATGTGIAPMLGFVQHLFPAHGESRSEGREFWLVYGTRYETDLYYESYFAKIAAEHANFHYLKTLSRPQEGWQGARGYVQELVAQIAERHAHTNSRPRDAEGFDIHAYICGLNDMVSASRDRLKALGWQRKQIIFERYD